MLLAKARLINTNPYFNDWKGATERPTVSSAFVRINARKIHKGVWRAGFGPHGSLSKAMRAEAHTPGNLGAYSNTHELRRHAAAGVRTQRE
jgi:hypothetical protein